MRTRGFCGLIGIGVLTLLATSLAVRGQTGGPAVLVSHLGVRTLVSGLTTPVSLAFLDPLDYLVIEKNTGQVKRVLFGSVSTVLDLPVNFASERGLLGIAIHPAFPADPGVYLYWTESSTGADTPAAAATPLLGNRVDRFRWNGSTLTFDRSIMRLRSRQTDGGAERGNHNGGVIGFGLDGKLYVFVGDVGRRGHLQNLPCGPTITCPGPVVPDDMFGGPEPDDAHLSGVILRLNADGTTPSDNPFFDLGASMGGEAGANTQRIFAYGFRNGIGMTFDPLSGNLWASENGDDSFDELNLVERGMNGGWVQIMGPLDRVAEYRSIETASGGLGQARWPPANIARTPAEVISRLLMLGGATYSDPEFSWRFSVAPAGIGFLSSSALGPEYEGDLFVGAASPRLEGGHLFRFDLAENRREIRFEDPRLVDRVADNFARADVTESESLRFGTGFGIGTDIRTGPTGTLFVVSVSNGAVYEIFRKGRGPLNGWSGIERFPSARGPRGGRR